MIKYLAGALCLALLTTSCGNQKNTSHSETDHATPAVPTFNADSAYAYIEQQCAYGARVPGTEAHERCGDYLAAKFRSMGLEVTEQTGNAVTCDGKSHTLRNIIASAAPEREDRILICAHWDCRPWADNDPDSTNHRTPVAGANDGASGVAVMLEAARHIVTCQPTVGVDFICFDLEDYGIPYWIEADPMDEMQSWCIGSQYWATHPHKTGYKARFGILLDMVGGQGARFYQEGFSLQFARNIVNQVWDTANRAGYGDFFPKQEGGFVTDDHLPINQLTGIPTIDIIGNYPDFSASSFGPTWHTVNDVPTHIDRNTLKAAGQTLLQVIYETH